MNRLNSGFDKRERKEQEVVDSERKLVVIEALTLLVICMLHAAAGLYVDFFEKNVLSNACSGRVEDIDDTTKKIIVQADSSTNGVADVYIGYEVQKRDRKLRKVFWIKDI